MQKDTRQEYPKMVTENSIKESESSHLGCISYRYFCIIYYFYGQSESHHRSNEKTSRKCSPKLENQFSSLFQYSTSVNSRFYFHVKVRSLRGTFVFSQKPTKSQRSRKYCYNRQGKKLSHIFFRVRPIALFL